MAVVDANTVIMKREKDSAGLRLGSYHFHELCCIFLFVYE